MKIYQLHEYSGQWEDFLDCIIGSYLRKERAEEEKIKAEAKAKALLKQGKKCNHCPYLLEDTNLNVEDVYPLFPDYCSDANLEEFEGDICCENYCSYDEYDVPNFEIIEVEVEE